jgi:multicomponent Na+:H+ antiporter subunit E
MTFIVWESYILRTKRIIFYGAISAGFWLSLAESKPHSWIAGIPAILVVVVIQDIMLSPYRIRLDVLRVTRFVPWFIGESILAGCDVSRRILQARVDAAPAIFEFSTSLPRGLPRTVLLYVINLLPGTATAGIDDDVIAVHVLDFNQANTGELIQLERKIGELFRIRVTQTPVHPED